MSEKGTATIIHDEVIGDYRARLTATGRLLVSYRSRPEAERPWYKDPATRAPWIPRQSSFVALVSQSIKDGKYADLKHLAPERELVPA